jgi:Pyruvate/2-oxoacid:ferredoxin oxidoreductase delta subunit
MCQGVSALWLDDTPCIQCAIGGVHPFIVRNATSASRLLSLYGRPSSLRLYSTNQESLQKPRKVQVADPRRPTYSRRDLFGALRRAAAETIAEVAEGSVAKTPADSLAPHLPGQRALLAAALPRLGQPRDGLVDTAGLPLSQVVVSTDCSACGLCAKLCPSGALAFRSDDTSYVLEFRALQCVGEVCHICRLICLEQAVSLSLQANPAEMLQGGPQVLRAGALAACGKCGKPAARQEGATLCHLCRWTQRRIDMPAKERTEAVKPSA